GNVVAAQEEGGASAQQQAAIPAFFQRHIRTGLSWYLSIASAERIPLYSRKLELYSLWGFVCRRAGFFFVLPLCPVFLPRPLWRKAIPPAMTCLPMSSAAAASPTIASGSTASMAP